MSKILRLLASLAIVGVLALRVDWGQVGSAFADLQWSWWLFALALYLATQIVSALRWRLLAGAVGLRGRAGSFITDYFVGMFFNLFLPTSVGGDVVRAWRLAKRSREAETPGGRLNAVLSVLADRVSGLIVLIALACVATLFCPVPLPAPVIGSVLALGIGAVLGLASLPVLRRVLLPRLRVALPKLDGPLEKLQRMADGAALTLGNPSVLLGGTLLSLVIQAANVVVVWMVGCGLGLEVPLLYYGVLVPLVTLLTMLPVSLNGVGLREAGYILFLNPLGVEAARAVTLGLLTFAVYTLASLAGIFFLIGGPSRSMPRRSLEVRPDDESVGGDPDQGRARQPPAAA
jgi:uncharacterized protein (TIRG00374 family)